MSERAVSVPPELPGFRFVETLGSGGSADVFKYEQVGLGRPVAVKVLLRGLGDTALEHFRSEANLMAQLSNHPYIVSIYQAGVADDGRPYLVMEFCPPPHLGTRLGRHPLSVAKALEVAVQLAGAVETAHRLGILHRDIKPSNILFTEFGRPALTDFGIAHGVGERAALAAYSVAWAPPEQLTNQASGPAGDVYSLGATVWAMLVGHSPFDLPAGPNDHLAMLGRVLSGPVPVTGRADVPESLERVLRVAMAKDPERRYSSVLEFGRALQGVQAQLHQTVTFLEVVDDVGAVAARNEESSATLLTSSTSVPAELDVTELARDATAAPVPSARVPERPGRRRRAGLWSVGVALVLVAAVTAFAFASRDVPGLLAVAPATNEAASPASTIAETPGAAETIAPGIAETTDCANTVRDARAIIEQVASEGGAAAVAELASALTILEGRCGVVYASDVALEVSNVDDLPAAVRDSAVTYAESTVRYPAPAASTVRQRIESPTFNISCELALSSVGCSILERTYPPEQDCGERLFSAVLAEGDARTACGTEWLGVPGDEFYTVSYGETVTYGAMACVEEDDGPRRGMTCWDTRTGNSLLLARARFEISNDGAP